MAVVLAGCGAFDRRLLAPLGDGDQVPGVDAGRDSGPQAPFDAGYFPSDASMPGERMDAAPPEAGMNDAGNTGDAALEDATVNDAALDGGDGGDDCTPSGATDYCSALPSLSSAPVIDGALDCGLQLMRMPSTGWNGASAPSEAHRTHFAFAHRPDGLYVFIEVRGRAPAPHPALDPIYCGDAIELYIDADGLLASDGSYDDPGTIQLVAAAPASLAAPNTHAELFVSGASRGAWLSTQHQLVWLEDGYVLEAFIAAADLGLESWAPATAIGIDVVIDVAGPAGDPDLRCGLQLGQYFWRISTLTPSGCDGEPWCDTRALCTPSLQ